MSFFLEDDDPYSQEFSQSQLSQGGLLSQVESQFHCDNCGGTESYQDAATGQTVCSDCFTQSQQATQETALDFEDIMGLAAKTRGGALVQRAVFKNNTTQRRRKRVPLETFDSSAPLPSLDVCLKGMQCVLRKSTKILCELADIPERYHKKVDGTVKRLWMAYLRAFADGAEHYGRILPHIRMCLRDKFIRSSPYKTLIVKQLAAKITQELQQQQQQQEQQQAMPGGLDDDDSENEDQESEDEVDDDYNGQPDVVADASNQVQSEYSRTSSQKRRPSNDDNSENEKQESKDNVDTDDKDEEDVTGDFSNKAPSEPTPKRRRKYKLNFPRLIQASAGGKRLGYKEAALMLRLDMRTAAVFLWLAVSRSGVTSAQMCRWIASGHLPLLQAFRLLTPELQRALSPIKSFFRNERLFTPCLFEGVAVKVAVACRYKPGGGDNFIRITPYDERLRFWTRDSLPLVVASYVQEAGLDQGVLNRTLALMGLRESPVLSMDAAAPEKLTCPEDILAVVAMACQLDPEWRSWTFTKDSRSTWTIPWNEKQLRTMTNGPRLSNYLDFVETNFLCPDDIQCNELAVDDDETVKSDDWVPPPRQIDETPAGKVRPSPAVAGVLATQPVVEKNVLRYEQYFSKMSEVVAAWTGVRPRLDSQQLLLIEFLAHSAQADALKIERFFFTLFEESSMITSQTFTN